MALESSIKDAIFDVILAAYEEPSDSQQLLNECGVFLSRVWPGQSISESQYSNAWSPTNPTGKQAVTEDLSKLVDSIPNFSNTYSTSGRGVEEEYGQVVSFAHLKFCAQDYKSSQIGHAHAGLGEASDSSLEDVFNLGREVLSALGLPSLLTKEILDRVETAVKAPNGKIIKIITLTQTARDRNNLVIEYANQSALLKAIRAILPRSTPAEKQTLQIKMKQVEASIAKGQENLRALQPQVASSLKTESSIKASPSVNTAFYQAQMMFKRSELSSLRNPGLQYHPSYLSPDNWAEMKVSADWPFITIPIQSGDSRIQLSLRFSRVDIIRPWFLMSLFELPDWEMPQGPGSLSNGEIEDNQGSFSLLPVSMIVTRDIKAVDDSGTTLFQVPGLQILAWVSQIMPFSPPLSSRESVVESS